MMLSPSIPRYTPSPSKTLYNVRFFSLPESEES